MTKRKNKSATHELFEKHAQDFAYCEQIIKEKSKSFYAAFSRLPREKALSVYAIYAFCREADDSIDLFKDEMRLNRLKQELLQFQEGVVPNRPVWRALSVVFQLYPMDFQAFYDMIKGQEMDAVFVQPETQEELEDYCYYVAGSVGLMLLPLLTKEPEKIKGQAVALGKAMQLTNILRDVGEDYRASRIYLPVQKLEQFKGATAAIENNSVTKDFAALWEMEAQRAEVLYDTALPMMRWIEPDCQEPLLLAALFYREILAVVREHKYECFSQKHFVKKSQKLALYYSAKMKLKEV